MLPPCRAPSGPARLNPASRQVAAATGEKSVILLPTRESPEFSTMPLPKLVITAAVALALGAAAFTSYAQDVTITPDPALSSLSVEDMVAKRQELMKTNGGTLKTAGSLTGADAVKAAETLITDFSNLTVL